MNRIIGILFSVLMALTSCVVVNNPSNQYEAYLPAYKPVPVNRVARGTTFFNTHNYSKIRVNGIPLEIINSNKSELEVNSNYIEYLKVMSLGDELYIFYDIPSTGSDGGFRKYNHKFVLHTRQPITGIIAESSSSIVATDMIKTPHIDINVLIGAKVKANISSADINIFAESTGSFSGWLDADRVSVRMRNAAIAELSGVTEVADISTSESSSLNGNDWRIGTANINSDSKSRVPVIIREQLDAYAKNRSIIKYQPISEARVSKQTDSGGVIEIF